MTRALIARAAEARDVLPAALSDRGAEVDVVALYETVAEPLSDAQRAAVTAADYVTFTSSSTVRFFYEQAGDALGDATRLASIGPVTSDTLREHGREPDVQAERHDIDGLVEAARRRRRALSAVDDPRPAVCLWYDHKDRDQPARRARRCGARTPSTGGTAHRSRRSSPRRSSSTVATATLADLLAEMAAEAGGPTAEDRAWARGALGLD